jgi:membrane protein involved in colicin uptake
MSAETVTYDEQTSEVTNILEQFKELTALEQATFLKQAAVVHERSVRQAIKESAVKRKRLTPEEKAAKAAQPKKEQPPAVKAWLDYVQLVFVDMKAADPAAKYGNAMAEAKKRRDEGTDDRAPAKAVKEVKAPKEKKPKAEGVAPKKPRKAAIVTASPEGSVASAPSASTVSTKLSKEEKAALKAEKEAAKAAEKAEKEAAKVAEKAAKEAAKAAEKAAKEAAKAAKVTKGKPAPAPAPAPAQDEESLTAWNHKGAAHYRSSRNECWLKAADGSMGAWVGIYNPVTDKIEAAPEPELE